MKKGCRVLSGVGPTWVSDVAGLHRPPIEHENYGLIQRHENY